MILAVIAEHADSLRQAVDAYQEALRFCTAEAAPLDYAMTQFNLGNAYSYLAAVEDQALSELGDNLSRSIDAYHEALRFWTPEAAPFDYAITQQNLGIALEDFGVSTRGARLLA